MKCYIFLALIFGQVVNYGYKLVDSDRSNFFDEFSKTSVTFHFDSTPHNYPFIIIEKEPYRIMMDIDSMLVNFKKVEIKKIILIKNNNEVDLIQLMENNKLIYNKKNISLYIKDVPINVKKDKSFIIDVELEIENNEGDFFMFSHKFNYEQVVKKYNYFPTT